LIPKTGVYVVKSILNNKTVFGMMNIGFRPTINGENQTIEVHFFDFNDNLYNQNLTVAVLYFLRDEEKFTSIEKLTDQLKIDKKNALNYLQNNL
jgi:riboflavin kinase/FMN adenylyltransferase